MIGARQLAGVLPAISLGLAATPALAQTPEQHEFTIDTYTYTVPVPAGFCVPVDGQVALAEQVAALDAMNFTHAAFDRCGSFGVDYVHIKSPRESERVPLTKPMFEDAAFRASVLAKIKLGRIGTPADLMGALVFLSSRAADYVNGHILAVDGGYLVR